MNEIRLAVVGVGSLGHVHAEIYSKLNNARVVAVCDLNGRRARKIAAPLGAVWTSDYRELPRYDIDAVSIVTPTESHFSVARFFIKRGIHCLIEKPITKRLAEARELIMAAEKNNTILQVGHVERFNSAIQTIERLSPKPRFIEVHRLGPFTPRVKDVGVVLDLMIHDIDIVLGLTHSRVRDIQAIGMKILTRHEDIANARLRFENGTICDLTASRVTSETLRKIRIFQEDCYISIDYVKQAAAISRKVKDRIVSRDIDIKKERPLDKELSSFVECVREGKRPLVTGLEAYNALKIAHRILRKLKI